MDEFKICAGWEERQGAPVESAMSVRRLAATEILWSCETKGIEVASDALEVLFAEAQQMNLTQEDVMDYALVKSILDERRANG